MTKDEIVDLIVEVDTQVVFTILATAQPWLNIPIISWVVKYFIKLILRPAIEYGVVGISFKIIDAEQLSKAKTYEEALDVYKEALKTGNIPESVSSGLDDAFLDAIRIRPK